MDKFHEKLINSVTTRRICLDFRIEATPVEKVN